MTPNLFLLGLYVLLLVAAAVQDVATRRIANGLSVAILVTGILALIVNGGPEWWQHVLGFLAMLGIGIFLFSVGWIGGGDAKLAAATAFAFTLSGLLNFLLVTVLAGGLLAILSVVRVMWIGGSLGAVRKSQGVPYGLAIAAGAIAALFLFPAASVFEGPLFSGAPALAGPLP